VTGSGYYDDEAVFHLNGRSPFAGDHRGVTGFVEVFSKVMGTADSDRQEVLDVAVSDQHSVGLLTSTVERGGKELTADLVTVLAWPERSSISGSSRSTRTRQTPSTPGSSTWRGRVLCRGQTTPPRTRARTTTKPWRWRAQPGVAWCGVV
jgi:hypothetical protein